MTPAGYLVVIVWWTSMLEEMKQWSFHLLKALSALKIVSSEKNLMTEPFALIQFNNFLHLFRQTSFILLVKRCLLSCAKEVRPSCFKPLWVFITLTALFLAIVESGMVGFGLTILPGPARKWDVKIFSLLALWVALWSWPDSSKCFQTWERACLGSFGDLQWWQGCGLRDQVRHGWTFVLLHCTMLLPKGRMMKWQAY